MRKPFNITHQNVIQSLLFANIEKLDIIDQDNIHYVWQAFELPLDNSRLFKVILGLLIPVKYSSRILKLVGFQLMWGS